MSTDSLAYAKMRWNDGAYGWTETDNATYYAMLGAVTPLRRDGRSFICGETYDTTRDGRDVYYVFLVTGGEGQTQYWVRLWTEREYIAWMHSSQVNAPGVKTTISPDGIPSQT